MKKTINLNVQKKILTYHIKRNEFLVWISNEQYCKIFKMLNKHLNIFCSTWHQWLTLNHNVMKSLQKIMKHIMFWYSRSWKYSVSHNNDLKTFNWSAEIEQILFKKCVLSSDMKQSWADKNSVTVSEQLLREIWNTVLKKNNFHESALKLLISLVNYI